MGSPLFKVSLEDAQKFQTVWTYKGLAIPLPKEAAQYATDFANIVLRNFIAMCQEQAKEAAKSQIPAKQLIAEGLE